MDEEFKLCWKNFQDNIASGFQNLYDRGDLVDVTLACDGKLLHAHKIVLAICSPYFQEIFITNPCKHPIIILKDVTFNIMCELLEFMYQGVVNVKHAELQSFMKIGQLLQIKGLATNSSSSTASTSSDKSTSQIQNQNPEDSNRTNDSDNPSAKTPVDEKTDSIKGTNENPPINISKSSTNNSNRSRSPSTSLTTSSFTCGLVPHHRNIKTENSPVLHHSSVYHATNALKRQADFPSSTDSTAPIFSRKQLRRSIASAAADQSSDLSDANESATGIDSMSNEDFLLPSISMVESRYDLNNHKREHSNPEREYREGASAAAAAAAAASLRNTFGAPFGFDYNLYKNSSNASSGGGSNASPAQQAEYPNELHMPNDYSKNFGNHMDIPSNGSNLVMLSSTSLLHGNCVFNRNNTVATQQGMKTYWLCKSYRVSMCRARCITHQGRIISATGVHNHPPHMRGGQNSSGSTLTGPNNNNSSGGYNSSTDSNVTLASTVQPSGGGIGGVSTAIAAGNNNGLCNTTIHSLSRLSQNSVTSNVFAHNVHGHNCSQQAETSPHPTTLFANPNHTSPINHHHTVQSSLTISQASGNNGVIQNMFHNAANLMQLPNMLPPPTSLHEQHHHHHHLQHQQQQQQPHQHQPHQQHQHPHPHPHPHQHQQHPPQHQQQHSPHLSHHSAHLEITSIMHATSPSNATHQHNNSALSNSASSTIKGETVSNNTLHSLPRSPSQIHMNDDATLGNDQNIMVHNAAALSPNSEINPPTNIGSSADVSLASQSEAEHDSSHHQAQVIDSITISPPNASDGSQHFKMEEM